MEVLNPPAINTGLQALQQTTQAKKVTQETKKLAEETITASVDADVKTQTGQTRVYEIKAQYMGTLIQNDLKQLDTELHSIYIKAALEELAVKSREANIAKSELGILMRKIKEVSESVGIKGSDFMSLIPTGILRSLNKMIFPNRGTSSGPNLFKGKPR